MHKSTVKSRAMSTTLPKTHLPKIIPINTPTKLDLGNNIKKKLFVQNRSVLLRSKDIVRQRMMTEQIVNGRISQRNPRSQFTKHTHKMLDEQVEGIIYLFKEMSQLRQEYGVVSIDDGDQDMCSANQMDIPYNPELHCMNEQICSLRSQIQKKMENIFKIAKDYPKIKAMIQNLLEQYANQSLHQTVRIGKIAAMKAHRRLIVAYQQQLHKIGKQ